HAGRDHEQDGLAEAHRPWVHGRRDEESRVHRRVLQTGGRRANLSDQPVASNPFPLARPAPAAAGFFASCLDTRPLPVVTKALTDTPTGRRASERGTNVAQQRPTVASLAAAVTLQTSRQEPGTALGGRDFRRGFRPRSE